MQREESVDLHDSEIVAEKEPGGNMDDILRSMPEMRCELNAPRD